MCAFSDDIRTTCSIVSLNEIECDTPLGFETNSTSRLTLLFNNSPVETRFEYTFLSEKYFLQPGDSSSYEEIKKKTIFKSMASMFKNIIENVKNKFY